MVLLFNGIKRVHIIELFHFIQENSNYLNGIIHLLFCIITIESRYTNVNIKH